MISLEHLLQESIWFSFCLSFWTYSWVFSENLLEFFSRLLKFPDKINFLFKYCRGNIIFGALRAIFLFFSSFGLKYTRTAFTTLKMLRVFLKKNCYVLEISRILWFFEKYGLSCQPKAEKFGGFLLEIFRKWKKSLTSREFWILKTLFGNFVLTIYVLYFILGFSSRKNLSG